MSLYPYQLYSRRIDADQNMARYYSLSIQATLFGEIAVTRRWGRIGVRGGEMTETFACERQAAIHFLDLARKKHRKGYRPIGNCGDDADKQPRA
ncbi:WGR domain-containing protein [Rhizobium sp. KVB221]|uniref:WGR domain-containing protein n=1 Tax=Rhizobium setariae TaxID=2801340 RepID=A0A937CQV8_9HYPH|nr:WGR domain-containing protein [Rhizobium setariae]MBL0373507.1 WGR domain-containing protein [Rhizobium setariae]